MKQELIELDYSQIDKPVEGADFFETRKIFAKAFYPTKIIISVVTWNQLEKTKKCVEYLLKYTSHIEFDLVFFDNNSEDDTIEFLKSVEHPRKTIYSSNKNMGIAFALNHLISTSKCEYYININNDCYVTKNWLDNILACFESDEKIAFICPMSSNMSNNQDPHLKFKTLEEMQKAAELFNRPDPSKWQEKVRLIGAVTCYRKFIFDLIGIMDAGFVHNFSDDDISYRILNTGYKQVLAGDVFIHHDHYHNKENNQEKTANNLSASRKNFQQKHHGIDAWDDMGNYEPQLLNMASYQGDRKKILGIDVRLGVPLGEMSNKLKEKNMCAELFAYTTHAKFYKGLTYVCEDHNHVICDRIDFINEHYQDSTFDYILIGECINSYADSLQLLSRVSRLLKKDGQILFKLYNTQNLTTLLDMFGQYVEQDGKVYTDLSHKCVIEQITKQGDQYKVAASLNPVPAAVKGPLEEHILKLPFMQLKDLNHLYIREFLFCATRSERI